MTLRRAFVVCAVLWAVLLPVAAFAVTRPSASTGTYALALAVYGAGSYLCHQLPERSFHLWTVQLPVCARCTGIYAGGAVAAIARVVTPSASADAAATRRARMLVAVALLPTAATLAFEWTTGQTPSNTIRALAGVPLGAAAAWIMAGVNY
jgi:uncharacterized membrane protein